MDTIKENWRNYMVKTIHTDKAPAAIGPYVQGKIVGNLLFASGQVPLSPETGEIIGETIQEQTEQVLKNVGAIFKKATKYLEIMSAGEAWEKALKDSKNNLKEEDILTLKTLSNLLRTN